MPLRAHAESPEQEATQVRYIGMIDNLALKTYVLDKRSNPQPQWYVATSAQTEADSATNTENRLKALNSALMIAYSQQEYLQLLAGVGITPGPGQLTDNQLASMLAENKAFLECLNDAEKERIVAIFAVIYSVLRETDGLFTSNFVDDLHKYAAEPAKQYSLIETHVKEGILAGKVKQRRSVDAWFLLQDVLWGRYLPLSDLAQAIFNVSKSSARRASESACGRAAARQQGVDAIKNSLQLSEQLLKPWPNDRRLSRIQKAASNPAISPSELEAIKTVLAKLDLHSHAPWLESDTVLTVGTKIVEAIKEAVIGGAHKGDRKPEFEKWQEAILTNMFRYLSLNHLQVTPALGLYFFCQCLPVEYCPADQVTEALAAATSQDKASVLSYLNHFLTNDHTARQAHVAFLATQLGVNDALPTKMKDTKYAKTLVGLIAAFINLVALSQTPYAVLVALEQMANLRAKATGKASSVSSIDLELATTNQAIRMALIQLRDLKKNASCQRRLNDLAKDIIIDLLKFGAALSLKEREAEIARLKAENAELRAENAELKHRGIAEISNSDASPLKRQKTEHAEVVPVETVKQTYASQGEPNQKPLRINGINLDQVKFIEFLKQPTRARAQAMSRGG